MTFANALDAFRIPQTVLIALYSRDFHIAIQPYEYLIRAVHVLAVSAFTGAIAILDVRLIGPGAAIPLRPLVGLVLPWVYGAFALTMLTGIILFTYDPVEVGSHDWLTPKLLFLLAGLINAVWFNATALPKQMANETGLTFAGKAAGITSLILWALVVLCACLNAEPPPRLLLGS